MLGKIDLLLVAFAIVCYLAVMYDFYIKQESFERGKALLDRRKRYMDIASEKEKREKRLLSEQEEVLAESRKTRA